MIREKEYETEDPIQAEAAPAFAPIAATEYQTFISQLKYESRKSKLLHMRQLGRSERIRLRKKYNPA